MGQKPESRLVTLLYDAYSEAANAMRTVPLGYDAVGMEYLPLSLDPSGALVVTGGGGGGGGTEYTEGVDTVAGGEGTLILGKNPAAAGSPGQARGLDLTVSAGTVNSATTGPLVFGAADGNQSYALKVTSRSNEFGAVMIGGHRRDSPTVVGNNTHAEARMTAWAALHVQLRDELGDEIDLSDLTTATEQTAQGTTLDDILSGQLADDHNVTVSNPISGFATQITLAALLAELQLKADLLETQPVSAVALPLPSGAATSALQLPDGHAVTVDNASGGAAVNIQDGGNSITVDGTVAATQATVATTVESQAEVSVTTSTTALLAADAAVKRIVIQNHGTSFIRVHKGATALVTSPIRLAPEIGVWIEEASPTGDIYQGQWAAIVEAGGATGAVGVLRET